MQNAVFADRPHLQNAATPPGCFADAAHANAAPCQGGGPAQKAVDFSRDSSLNATAGLILVGTTDPRVCVHNVKLYDRIGQWVRTSNISARRDLGRAGEPGKGIGPGLGDQSDDPSVNQ